jgi:hypothetical protein
MPRAPKNAPSADTDLIIAEREFELREGRKRIQVLAHFLVPVPHESLGFQCEYRIEPLTKNPIVGRRPGIDPIQAFQMAQESAAVELLASRAYQSGRLTLLGTHDLGMPVPKSRRCLIRWDLEAQRMAREIRGAASTHSRRALRTVLERRSSAVDRASAAPVILRRMLELNKEGVKTAVQVQFRKPTTQEWGLTCAVEVQGLLGASTENTRGVGFDGINALHNAMRMATLHILTTSAYQEGNLTWRGGYELGMPVIEDIAALVRTDLHAKLVAQKYLEGPTYRDPRRR